MGKTLLLIFTIFVVVLGITYGFVLSQSKKSNEIYLANKYYEDYLNSTVSGTELATIIGKAIEQNINNRILKDQNGMFKENDTNSVKIYLVMGSKNQSYPMEAVFKGGIDEFVKYNGEIYFRCTNIEHHKKSGLVSKITFAEIKE